MRGKSERYWHTPRFYFPEFAAIAVASILITITSTAFSQKGPSLDSLEKKIETLSGTEKANVLYELVYGYLRVDIKKASDYSRQVSAA